VPAEQWRALVLCATVVAVVQVPRAATQDDARLTQLEASLGADPDSLERGNEYRKEIIRSGQYDRALKFFARLVGDHPGSANAHLNYGFAYVDKVPTAGSITQVILANNALTEFSRALEIQPSWLAYYTRGNSYLFWPKIFGRTASGIADLEAALRIQRAEPVRPYHVRVYVALGDGYWKMENLERARATWGEGARLFPSNRDLQVRLQTEGDDLRALIETGFDPTKRVDTDLEPLWASR